MVRARAGAACAVLAGVVGACGGDATSADDAQTIAAQVAYVNDAASRRVALVESLVNPANSYSALRLAHYSSGDDVDWGLLPTWNPRVVPVADAALDGPAPLALLADARALAVPDEATWQPETATSLVALGEEAFFRYPAQLAPVVPLSRDLVAPYGLWRDDARGVGGLVWAETTSGVVLAMSCATCHADVIAGRLVAGVPSRFDLGRMLGDGGVSDPTIEARLLAWGQGRVDVTTSDGSVPERIGDLRPERWLSHLQYDATVRQVDLVSLAIRIETLIITSHGEALRPPRLVSLALAQYLWSLAAAQPAAGASASPGGALFSARCAGCHAGAGFTGPPRTLAEVGTDPTLGLSPARGTGFYRVPSLRGVSLRPSLLHDGTLPDLDAMFDPARLDDEYAGGAHRAGPVRGHVFGLDLPAADRAALLDYLRAL